MKAFLLSRLLGWIESRSYQSLCRLGRLLGWLWTWILPFRRGLIDANLRLAFPDSTASWRRNVRARCLEHYCTMGLELLWLRRMDDAWISEHVRFNNLEGLKERMQEGRGLIGVGGHFGNWEVMGAATSRAGIALSYIVKRIHEATLDDWINGARMSHGVEIIYTRDAGRGAVKHFRRGRMIAFLSDQDGRGKGVFVPFFGQAASTPRGAAVYALRMKLPMIFVSCLRRADGIFEVDFRQVPLEPEWTLCEEDIRALTARYTAMLEGEIRRHPEQWFWMHRRWKTKEQV